MRELDEEDRGRREACHVAGPRGWATCKGPGTGAVGGVGHSENLVLCVLSVRHPHEMPSARRGAVQAEYFFRRMFRSGSSVAIVCRPSGRILGS